MFETEERNEFFEKTVSKLPLKQFDCFQILLVFGILSTFFVFKSDKHYIA